MKKFIKWFFIVVGVLIIVGIFAGGGDGKSKSKEVISSGNSKISLTPNEIKLIDYIVRTGIETSFANGKSFVKIDYVTTTANEMIKVYSENEAKGDKTFKGKNIIISGVVNSVKSGIGDDPYVVLESRGSMFDRIQLSFTRESRNVASELSKGQKITFACVGGSVIIGSPMLNDCETIQTAINKNIEQTNALINKYIKSGKTESDTVKVIVLLSKSLGAITNDFRECGNIDEACFSQSMFTLQSYDGNNEYVNELRQLIKY